MPKPATENMYMIDYHNVSMLKAWYFTSAYLWDKAGPYDYKFENKLFSKKVINLPQFIWTIVTQICSFSNIYVVWE